MIQHIAGRTLINKNDVKIDITNNVLHTKIGNFLSLFRFGIEDILKRNNQIHRPFVHVLF